MFILAKPQIKEWGDGSMGKDEILSAEPVPEWNPDTAVHARKQEAQNEILLVGWRQVDP